MRGDTEDLYCQNNMRTNKKRDDFQIDCGAEIPGRLHKSAQTSSQRNLKTLPQLPFPSRNFCNFAGSCVWSLLGDHKPDQLALSQSKLGWMQNKSPVRVPKEHDMSLDEIGALIKNGSTKNIVICAGAGISTSAGIPDFRSPKTGLYHNLKKLNLDYPEQVFDIDFFRRRPEPFYQLAHELYPGNFRPTLTHSFIRLLHEKGLLLRCFTQNIDTLERRAGIPEDKLVEAHGSFAGNHCISPKCGKEADQKDTEETIKKKGIPRCSKCKSLVKPDIVFFGEGLPDLFFDRMKDFRKADLLIVLGTSLQVQPFASLPDRTKLDCPRVLINLEEVGNFTRALDVVQLGTCDDGVRQLAVICGWDSDLTELHKLVQKESMTTEGRTEAEELEKVSTKSDEDMAMSRKWTRLQKSWRGLIYDCAVHMKTNVV